MKMPTYEYECEKCEHRFEIFQSMNDKPLKTCPICGGRIRRLFGTGAGIIFKGSGFYTNDSKEYNTSKTRCGKNTSCCGRNTPCEKPPCNE